MTSGQLRTYESHEYDVEFFAIHRKFSEAEFTNPKIAPKKEFLQRIKLAGEAFCHQNRIFLNIYFRKKIPLIIPSDDSHFEYFLSLCLVNYDIYKIKAFLTWQKDNYKGDKDFVKLVEFTVCKTVKNNSPFDNSVRLEKIMQWVEENPSTASGSKLDWQGKKEELRSLSNKLYKSRYVDNSIGFYDAIENAKKTIWLKEHEVLAYLLSSLITKERIVCSVRHGYIKISNDIFCAFSASAKKYNLKLYLDKVKRSPNKHKEKIAFVDKLVKDL